MEREISLFLGLNKLEECEFRVACGALPAVWRGFVICREGTEDILDAGDTLRLLGY